MVFWTPWDQIGTKWEEEEEEVVWLLAGCVSPGSPKVAPGGLREAVLELRGSSGEPLGSSRELSGVVENRG